MQIWCGVFHVQYYDFDWSYQLRLFIVIYGCILCVSSQCSTGGMPAHNPKGERLLIFIGIIDILQSYRYEASVNFTFLMLLFNQVTCWFFKTCINLGILYVFRFVKKLEHSWKALVHDGVCGLFTVIQYTLVLRSDSKILLYTLKHLYNNFWIFKQL